MLQRKAHGTTIVPSLRTAMSSARYILLIALVACFVRRAPAASGACLDRAIPVYVYTKQPGPVQVLKPKNFKASVRGMPIAVTDATDYRGPLRVLILIDASGSMTQDGKLNFGLVFARDLISLASPETLLALLTFSDSIEDTVPFGRGRAALLAEIGKLQDTDWAHMKGVRRTAIWDSLQTALALLKKPRLGDSIFVVTDGVDNASHSRESSVRARVESAGVRVYAVVFTPNLAYRGRTPEEASGPSEMRTLTAATGGGWMRYVPEQLGSNGPRFGMPVPIVASDRVSLMDAATLFYGEISDFVKLDVRMPGPLVKPRRLKLEMVDASGRKDKDLQVIYPRQLAPCAP